MIFVLLSTPTCAFIPKYHWLPFLVWCISGSRCCSRFLVDVGACRMVASTIVPVVMRTPRACKCRLTCLRYHVVIVSTERKRRERALRVVLIVVGLIFCGLAYPLMIVCEARACAGDDAQRLRHSRHF